MWIVTSGHIFNQNSLNSFIFPQKFDKRYRNHKIIAMEDFIDLRFLIHVKNYKNQYGHSDKHNYYLFIDEKSLNGHMTIGGIMINEKEFFKISSFINIYKKSINPILNPSDWYIKGDGKHEYIYKIFNIQKETKFLRIKRWSILGELLEDLDVNYSFHFSIVDQEYYLSGKLTRKQKSKERHEVVKKGLQSN